MSIDTVILLGAWIASLGLLGAVLVWYAQADAAQEKLATELVLIRRETQRRQTHRLGQ